MIFKNQLAKIAVIGVLCTAFLIQPAQAYAWWHGGWGWRGGWGWPVAAVALGAAATSIWIADHQYYYYDGLYYDYTPQGYVVVTPPVATTVVAAPQAAAVTQATVSDDVITLNIPNNKGGYTAVILKRKGDGFTGPQGEYYPEFPKVSQLKLMYGK